MGVDYELWTVQEIQKAKAHKMKLQAQPLKGKGAIYIGPISSFDPNVRNRKSETLLTSVVRYIDSKDMQPRAVDFNRQALDALKLLQSLDADPNATDKQGRTALFFACMEQKHVAAVYIIKQFKVDLRKKDRNGNTVLMYAASYGAVPVLEVLIESVIAKWSVDAFKERNNFGNNAHKMALLKNNLKCAALLDRRRVQLINRMYKQLALLNASAEQKGWTKWNGGYVAAFKAGGKWKKKSEKVREEKRTRSVCYTHPDLAKVSTLLVTAGPARRTTNSPMRRTRSSHK